MNSSALLVIWHVDQTGCSFPDGLLVEDSNITPSSIFENPQLVVTDLDISLTSPLVNGGAVTDFFLFQIKAFVPMPGQDLKLGASLSCVYIRSQYKESPCKKKNNFDPEILF